MVCFKVCHNADFLFCPQTAKCYLTDAHIGAPLQYADAGESYVSNESPEPHKDTVCRKLMCEVIELSARGLILPLSFL